MYTERACSNKRTCAHLEEAGCLELEDKLVMHLVGWLVLAETRPLVKQQHHLLAQPGGVGVVPH